MEKENKECSVIDLYLLDEEICHLAGYVPKFESMYPDATLLEKCDVDFVMKRDKCVSQGNRYFVRVLVGKNKDSNTIYYIISDRDICDKDISFLQLQLEIKHPSSVEDLHEYINYAKDSIPKRDTYLRRKKEFAEKLIIIHESIISYYGDDHDTSKDCVKDIERLKSELVILQKDVDIKNVKTMLNMLKHEILPLFSNVEGSEDVIAREIEKLELELENLK